MLNLGGTGTESAFLFLTRFVRNFAGVSAGEREKPNFNRYMHFKSSKHLQNSDVDDDDETMVMLSSDHKDDDGDDYDDDVNGALPC